MNLPPLPQEAVRLCEQLQAPKLLVRHLTLVHGVACEMLDRLAKDFPGMAVDREAVLFGAATHDLGKTIHLRELTGPGNRHEDDGPGLLIQHGVTPERARFARTHGRWGDVNTLEDLIVALADSIWCGRRWMELETKLASIVANMAGIETWEAWSKLDTLCDAIARHGEARLAWQGK